MERTVFLAPMPRNLWRTRGRMNFPLSGLALYLPLWHPDLSGSPIISKDLNAHSCTVIGTIHSPPLGRIWDGDDAITIPHHNDLNFGNGTTDTPFTILTWVNTADISNCILFSKGVNATSGREYGFFVNDNDLLLMDLWDASVAKWLERASDTTLTAYQNSSILLGATYDGWSNQNGITLYLNGAVLASSGATSGSYAAMENTGNIAQVGRLYASSAYANGTIKEVWVYKSRVLTAGEIQHIYLATKRN